MRLPLVLFAIALGTDAATAQTTRAEEDRAKRETKATQLIPERRSKLEAVLYKIDEDLILQRIFNPPRGIHARMGGIGEGAGFGGGPGYQFLGVPFDFRASAAGSLKGYFIAEGSLRFPGTQSEDLYTWANGPYVEVYARRRDFPQEDFYGIGPDSSEDARSNFALRDTFVRVTPAVRRGYLTAGVNLGYLDPSIGSGTDTRMPSTDEIFGPADVPGLDPAGVCRDRAVCGVCDPGSGHRRSCRRPVSSVVHAIRGSRSRSVHVQSLGRRSPAVHHVRT